MSDFPSIFIPLVGLVLPAIATFYLFITVQEN
nr:photosystem I subunit I [Cuscuta epithymum]WBF90906.1 photosystem I subunit I [Cuscuta epithymum]